MNKKNILIGLALVLSIALWSPAAVLAGEHGGSEHGGSTVKEHGGSAVSDDTATLQAAARALKNTRPDLAAKLEAMAKQ